MDNSPIVLFVYNRPIHTSLCIEALSLNAEAINSDLFIYSDFPATSNDIVLVKQVRDYIKNIKGFRTVTIVNREKNLGLAGSIVSGVTDVLDGHEYVIVLEDDLVVSEYFLKFMNDALFCYKDDSRVGSIHGYVYPVSDHLPETFFLRGADCWGWATWPRAWKMMCLDGRLLLEELVSRNLVGAFDLGGAYPYTKMLRNQIKGRNNSWAIRWHASLYLKGMLTLYPGKSLVQNIGHDGSGVHSAVSNALQVCLSDVSPSVGGIEVLENQVALTAIANFLTKTHSGVLAIIKRSFNKIYTCFQSYVNIILNRST
jgi:GR25 family glycosyltransferase involved in LPS biosynthesis